MSISQFELLSKYALSLLLFAPVEQRPFSSSGKSSAAKAPFGIHALTESDRNGAFYYSFVRPYFLSRGKVRLAPYQPITDTTGMRTNNSIR